MGHVKFSKKTKTAIFLKMMIFVY